MELGENFTINLAGCALQGVSELYLDGVNELPSYAGQFDEVYSSSAGEDNPVIVYVDGTVSASGNGQSAAAAFRDLEEAYAYLENHAAIRGGTIIVCGDLTIGGNVDLESNYNILGIVEITSCYGEEDFTSAATITFEAGATLYPTSRTWIHDITCYSEGVTYLYTGTDMVLGENIDAAASAAKNGLKVFCAEKSGSNTAQVNVTVNGGTYHSIYMGGNTGSTAGNITLTMNGGTVTTYFVMGPNSSERKPSVSGNLTFQMNGGSISTLCDTPNTGGQTGEVAMYLTGGSIGTAMKSYGSGGQIMEKVIVYLDASFGKLPAVFGDWDGSSVTNGTTLNLAGYSGEVPFSGFDVVNLEENSHVSCADALNDQNITVEAGCTLTLTYPGYTGPEKLPEDVCLAAAEGGTAVWADGGKVFYTEQEYPYVVYVSGDAAQSGDGMTAENAVKTLPEGYALLDPEAGGTIVVCGETEISTDTNLEEFEIEGQVELTSVYQGSNYAASNDAALVFQGKRYIYFGDNTYIHDLTLTTGSETVYVFCGSHLILGERIICHQNNTLKLFCCDSTPSASASSAKDFSLTVSSGDFDSVWMGGLTANTYVGDVDVTIEETAVLRLLVMGANKGNTGNLTVNVRGGTIQKVCNTPAASGARVENAVINFFGGSVESMVSYNDSPHYGLSATVNIHMSTAGNIPSSLGDWDAFYLPGTTSRLPVALNYLCYNGSAVTPGDFDTVRLFGTDILPESFTTASAGGERLLCIHAYEGVTSVDLSLFDRVAVTGDSDVTCVGVVPVSLVLLVDNSVFRIRPSQNPGVVLTDYTIQNNDTVLLEEPPYVEYEEILRMDFENGYALSSGASAVVVEPVQNGYVTSFAQGGFAPGYDGNTSLYFVNEFGENAQNYISFDLSNSGFDMTNEDYSILFWYKTENGGNDQWARAVHSTVAQTEVEMSSYVMGGTIFSNQDVRLDSDGMSLLQLTHYKYLASGVTDEEGEHYDADGIWQAQDDTWHHVAVSCDRDGYYSVYVDGELIAATNISACSDDSLGANVLVFGADALGQFGLGNAYIDDIVVYRGALNLLDVQARYEMDRIYALAFEIETRLEQLGSEYDPYRVGMEGELQSAIEQAEALDAEDFADMLSLYYDLKTCYEAFLSAPEENANLAVLLTSDIHLGSSGTSENLNRVLSQLQELGVEIDVLLSAGDFANAPYDQTIEEAYEYLYQLLDTYQMTDTLFVNALGNHDAYYKSASANYQTAVPLYWQYMMEHMEEMIEEETVTLDHASYYVDEDGILQSCSYAVTFQGYHFLVINTDYLPQTGNSGLVLDENGDYSIEGNEVDPIRHTLHISEESFSWMEEILDAWSEDGKPIFAVSHYLFENTAPLSFDSEIIINSNTIGEQDQQLRELLADYENVFYFCGHLHASFGVIEPYQVVVEDGGSFWEINLSSLKASARGYLPVPSTWLLYVYEDEMVLRARDFASGKWLTQFDQVLELSVN